MKTILKEQLQKIEELAKQAQVELENYPNDDYRLCDIVCEELDSLIGEAVKSVFSMRA